MENKKGNIFSQIMREYKKVHWASKKDIFQTTIIVLLVTLFIAIYITIFDFLFSKGLDGISNIIINLIK